MTLRRKLTSTPSKESLRKAWAQFVQWWVRHITKRPLEFKDEYGHVYLLHSTDHIAAQVARGRCTDDPGLVRFLRKNVTPGGTCVDVGANVGAITMAMATAAADVWVHAFEPELNNFSRLSANVALNNLERVLLHNLAVSEAGGIVRLTVYDDPKRSGHHTLGCQARAEDPGVRRCCVRSISLDEYCELMSIEHMDVLKIDVEGAEPEVLTGAADLLEGKRVGLIAFEISKVPLVGMGHDVADVVDPLKDCGYSIGEITVEGGVKWGALPSQDTYFGNYVATVAPGNLASS